MGQALQGAATTTEAGTIEEVVVTARRREEGVQSVPIPITAMSGDQAHPSDFDVTRQLQIDAICVQFEQLWQSGDRPTEFGLIAEEVAEVFPEP